MPQYRHACCGRQRLLEQLQPFTAQVRTHAAHAGDVGPGPREIADDAGFDWIGDLNEHDRDRVGGLLGCERRPGRSCDDQLDRKTDELGGKLRQRLGAAFGKAPVDCEIVAFHPAEVAQALLERAEHRRGMGAGRALGEDAEMPNLRLRARRARLLNRRCRRSTQERKKVAPPHCSSCLPDRTHNVY